MLDPAGSVQTGLPGTLKSQDEPPTKVQTICSRTSPVLTTPPAVVIWSSRDNTSRVSSAVSELFLIRALNWYVSPTVMGLTALLATPRPWKWGVRGGVQQGPTAAASSLWAQRSSMDTT